MQFFCNYKFDRLGPRRARGLTLLELVVVLAILVALAGMVAPLIGGLGYQANASTNATVVGEVNKAVRTYHARFEEQYPNGWDSLLNGSGTLFAKLHPNLTASSTSILQVSSPALTETQARSLYDAGIRQAYVHDASAPNTALTTTVSLTTGAKVAIVNSAAFANAAFNVYHLDIVDLNNRYVILGLGPNTTIRNAIMTDVPLISSADPQNYYARVLCVFMIPGTGATAEYFAAKFVGCFLPDGTSLRDNLDKYNNNSVAD